jgi:hypothetical protein
LGPQGGAFLRLNQWLEEYTWIVWYMRTPSGELNLVCDASANESLPFDDLGSPGHPKRWPFQCPPGVLVNPARTDPRKDLTSNSIPKTEYPLLQFWTLSVQFSIRLDEPLGIRAHIISVKGAPIGTVYLDGVEETTASFNGHDAFEFILLSRVMGEAQVYFGESGDCYYVMLLEWRGHVAERRGFGMLHRSAVADCFPPGPRWKEIILG